MKAVVSLIASGILFFFNSIARGHFSTGFSLPPVPYEELFPVFLSPFFDHSYFFFAASFVSGPCLLPYSSCGAQPALFFSGFFSRLTRERVRTYRFIGGTALFPIFYPSLDLMEMFNKLVP